MRYFTPFILALAVLAGCQNGSSDPHKSARPDSEGGPLMELSEEDRQKLAEARGKEATTTSLSSLSAILEEEEEKTIVCYLWSGSDAKSQQGLEELAALFRSTDPSTLGLLLLHSPVGKEAQEHLNTLVREQGLDADLYLLKAQAPFALPGSSTKWNGTYPSYYFYQAQDGTGLWYEGYLERQELEALLQPFLW